MSNSTQKMLDIRQIFKKSFIFKGHKNVGKDQNIGKLTTNLFKTRGAGMCGKIGILKIDTNFWSRRKTIIGKLGKVRKM